MHEPQPLFAPQPQSQRSLWTTAPGWRNMVLAAGMLSVGAGAALWLDVRDAAPPAPGGVGPVSMLQSPRSSPPGQLPTVANVQSQPPIAPPTSAQDQTQATPAAHPQGYLRTTPVREPAPAPQAIAPPPPISRARPASQIATVPAELASSQEVCRLSTPSAPAHFGQGVVVSVEDQAVSLARIPKTEAMLGGHIDPAYLHNVRISVRDGGSTEVFIIPRSLAVHVGDRVRTQGPYRSPNLPCSYVPPLITADLGPSPSVAPQPAPAAQTALASPPRSAAPVEGAVGDSCPITLPYAPRRSATGVVVAEIAPSVALNSIARDEGRVHGRLDPADVDLARVVVQVDGQHHPIVAVPHGMTVKLGDRIAMQDGHRSRAVPCGWTPNMVIDDFGPPPAAASPAPIRP